MSIMSMIVNKLIIMFMMMMIIMIMMTMTMVVKTLKFEVVIM